MIRINGQFLNSTLFPNQELNVDTKNLVLTSGTATIEFAYRDNTDLLELYFILAYINWLEKPIKTTLIMRYMPYSRMDRSQNGSCFTLKHVIRLLYGALPQNSQVYVIEPHSDVTEREFKSLSVDVYPVYTSKELVSKVLAHLNSIGKSIEVICYPDKGACARYSSILNLPEGMDVVHCNKLRDFDTGNIIGLELSDKTIVNHKNALIVDDLCSAGGTFYHTAKVLKDHGVDEVYLCVTHLESNVLNGHLNSPDSPIAHIYATDSMNTLKPSMLPNLPLTIYPLDDLELYKSILRGSN